MDFDQNGMDDIDPFTLRLLGPPPQGMDIHESSQPANYTIVCISLAVAIVAILLRWAARKISGAELQADDYVLNFVAFPLAISTAAVSILCRYGGGRHIWSLSRSDLAQGLKLGYAYVFVWSITVSITKLSIILFYRRIFVVHKKRFMKCLYGLMFITMSYVVTVIVCMATMCSPLSYYWRRFNDGAQGTCNNDALFLLASGSIDAFLNLAVLITPIPVIVRLEMTAKKKACVCAIMLLGCLYFAPYLVLDILLTIVRVCIASFVRVSYLVKYLNAVDKTWVSGAVSAWSSIESSFGIVSACLPVLRPLYLRYRDRYSRYRFTRKHTEGGTCGRSGSTSPWDPPSVLQKPKTATARPNGLSPYEDDIQLTSLAGMGSQDLRRGDLNRIVVHSTIHQYSSRVSE